MIQISRVEDIRTLVPSTRHRLLEIITNGRHNQYTFWAGHSTEKILRNLRALLISEMPPGRCGTSGIVSGVIHGLGEVQTHCVLHLLISRPQ